jgi:hypothetical protein
MGINFKNIRRNQVLPAMILEIVVHARTPCPKPYVTGKKGAANR